MRLVPCLLALLLVGACADDYARPISRPVTAQFASQSADEASIAVTARDRAPVETVELIAPDGTATPAYQIDRSRTAEESGGDPSVGVGVFGGSSGHIGTSVGVTFPVFGGGDSSDPVVDNRALIRVPDMDAYRAGWQGYRVRLRFGLAGENERVMEIPAPRPPEG